MIKVSPSVLSANFTRLGADCREVLDAGANLLVVGSAVFGAEDKAAAVKAFKVL
jgi:pentose-5-phosphate-3-epimerase